MREPTGSYTRARELLPPYSSSRPDARVVMTQEERRRAVRSTRIGAGTLACARCDAPVAIGEDRLTPADTLTCPYCGHQGPLREFLCMRAPTRPARVVVRVSWA